MTSRSNRFVPKSRNWLIAVSLAGLAFASACGDGCDPPPPNPPGTVGTVIARPVTGGFEVVLTQLDAPIRALSVGVAIDGGEATQVESSGAFAHDLVRADLATPKSNFILLVSDTRRVRLTDGAVARVDVNGPGAVTLSDAKGVDENGAEVVLAVEASQ